MTSKYACIQTLWEQQTCKNTLNGVLWLLPPVKEILDSFLHRLGFMHHGHWFVLQSSVSHTVVNVFILLEHPQLHFCLHTHCLWTYWEGNTMFTHELRVCKVLKCDIGLLAVKLYQIMVLRLFLVQILKFTPDYFHGVSVQLQNQCPDFEILNIQWLILVSVSLVKLQKHFATNAFVWYVSVATCIPV